MWLDQLDSLNEIIVVLFSVFIGIVTSSHQTVIFLVNHSSQSFILISGGGNIPFNKNPGYFWIETVICSQFSTLFLMRIHHILSWADIYR